MRRLSTLLILVFAFVSTSAFSLAVMTCRCAEHPTEEISTCNLEGHDPERAWSVYHSDEKNYARRCRVKKGLRCDYLPAHYFSGGDDVAPPDAMSTGYEADFDESTDIDCILAKKVEEAGEEKQEKKKVAKDESSRKKKKKKPGKTSSSDKVGGEGEEEKGPESDEEPPRKAPEPVVDATPVQPGNGDHSDGEIEEKPSTGRKEATKPTEEFTGALSTCPGYWPKNPDGTLIPHHVYDLKVVEGKNAAGKTVWVPAREDDEEATCRTILAGPNNRILGEVLPGKPIQGENGETKYDIRTMAFGAMFGMKNRYGSSIWTGYDFGEKESGKVLTFLQSKCDCEEARKSQLGLWIKPTVDGDAEELFFALDEEGNVRRVASESKIAQLVKEEEREEELRRLAEAEKLKEVEEVKEEEERPTRQIASVEEDHVSPTDVRPTPIKVDVTPTSGVDPLPRSQSPVVKVDPTAVEPKLPTSRVFVAPIKPTPFSNLYWTGPPPSVFGQCQSGNSCVSPGKLEQDRKLFLLYQGFSKSVKPVESSP